MAYKMWPEVKMTTKHRSETATRCKHRVMTHQCEVFVLLESHMTERVTQDQSQQNRTLKY